MMIDDDFLDKLLEEAEDKEQQWSESYFDLLLLQIKQLQETIELNTSTAEREVQIINEWALNKNYALQVKIDWIEKKLEAFIRERKEKTISLAHGVLKFHKKPDKIEISDPELFLKHARPEMLTIVPESVKPDLLKIKAYMKTRSSPPLGITIIEGKEEFSYKLNNRKENQNGGQEEAGTSIEYSHANRVVI